jgi:hypothetical protein
VEWETDVTPIDIPPATLRTFAARVRIEDGSIGRGGHDVRFTLSAADDGSLTTTETGRFFAP